MEHSTNRACKSAGRLWGFLAVCMCAVACRARQATSAPEPVTVRVVTLRQDGAKMQSRYVGKVESAATTTLLAPYSGTLSKVAVKEGQRVRKGDILAKVTSQSVQSAHSFAKADLARARDAHARVTQLKAGGTVPEIKMVELQTQLEQAESAERAARKAVDEGVIRAPYNGVVEKVHVRAGVRVTALEPLLRVHDAEGMQVRFPVPENEILRLRVGMPVTLEIPAVGRQAQATLSSKGVIASDLSHTYDCCAHFSDSAILPGMVGKVRIDLGVTSGVMVPATALRTGASGRYVWCVESDGRVASRAVSTGGFAGESVIVTHGLSAGDRVVVEGGRKVSGGMPVRVTEF